MKNTRKRDSKLFYFLQSFVDIALICIGFNLSFIAYNFYFGIEYKNILIYFETMPLIIISSLIFIRVYGIARCGERHFYETILSVFLALFFIDLTSVALTFFYKGFGVPRSIFLMAFSIQLVLLVVWKAIVYRTYYIFNKAKTVTIVGYGEEAFELARKAILKGKNFFDFKSFCDVKRENAYEKIKAVDAVIISPELNNSEKAKIISQCISLNKSIYIIPELFEISLFNARITQFDDLPVFCIDKLNLSVEQQFIKRAFDIIVAIICIILTSPVMLLTYISIKLYDGGPALFSQDRITRWNREFKLYKFRTMVVDAEEMTGPVLATEKDSRITPMGAFLRATRIDELPQFFNVLAGDMSIIGPRPERRFFIEQFEKDIPEFSHRLAVKAGITGLAQVMGKYTTAPKDKLRFDLIYIRNYSFLLDLKIFFQTIRIMFMKAASKGVAEKKVSEFILKDLEFAAADKYILEQLAAK